MGFHGGGIEYIAAVLKRVCITVFDLPSSVQASILLLLYDGHTP